MAFVTHIYSLSSAQFSFELDAVPQVRRLFEIHRTIGGSGRGRRRNLESINKSAIVLTCAFWEAFVEDLAAEAIRHLADHATSPDMLPQELKKSIAKALAKKKHELAAWDLASDGWRKILRDNADRLSHEDDQTLSSPSSRKVDDFFCQETGITGLADSWKWPGMTAVRAQARLDGFVKLRNAIAHRGGPLADSVTKKEASDGLALIERLAGVSLAHVNQRLGELVGKRLVPDPVPIELPSL